MTTMTNCLAEKTGLLLIDQLSEFRARDRDDRGTAREAAARMNNLIPDREARGG
jgi:hypothetical protein